MDEVHTLITELLADDVASYIASCSVSMVKPEAQEEVSYADDVLEQRYQSAMRAFRACNLDLMRNLADKRPIDLQ